MAESSRSENVFTKRFRIEELARQRPAMAFFSLNHLLDLEALELAYERTRKDGATGVDGQTAADYAANLQGNLQSLLERAQSGTYRAPPVRRVRIPKEGAPGETRPLGIPTFEDKVLQRAVAWILEAIYEQDFYPCSYGFRRWRGAGQAVDELRNDLMNRAGGWVLEVDIRKFFDTLDHGVLRQLLAKRVRDGVLVRLIGKWLKAGVLEAGAVTYPEAGSPQGGVISPLLANLYLHYVLDEWFATEVQPRLQGRATLTRYADDFVIVFAEESDARRVLEVLPKRFSRFGLTIHPDKTRLVPFRHPYAPTPATGGERQGPGTFDFLGFTFLWGKTRSGRSWVVQTKTARTRVRRTIARISEWCRRHRHLSIAEQRTTLSQKLQGHYAYFGRPGNYRCLAQVHRAALGLWRYWLSRRSQRTPLTWVAFWRLLTRHPLPTPHLQRRRFALANL
jgi:RNA-directed DNA polymerase